MGIEFRDPLGGTKNVLKTQNNDGHRFEFGPQNRMRY